MKRKIVCASLVFGLLFSAVVFMGMHMGAHAFVSPSVQLGLTLDGSGSISPSEFTIIKNGVASAIRNFCPHDGSVELTVVQFGSDTAQVEVSPTIVTTANFETVATTIENIPQIGSTTPMADGVYLTWDTMKNSPNFANATKQVINVATDGAPNVNLQAIPPSGWGTPPGNAKLDVAWVRDKAAAEGLDEIDAEGIPSADINWMRDYLVYPQPGTIAPPYTPGWVQWFANAQEFADAISKKFVVLFPPEHELVVSLEAPDYLNLGESVLLNATVYNGGLSNETEVELFLRINGTVANNVTILELVNGTYHTIDYLWSPTIASIYNITAYATPVPSENSTTNNVAWKYVDITGMHDVAVVNITPSETSVKQGYSLPINVTIENPGNYTENFNVTAYYGNGTITSVHWDIFWSMGDVNLDGYINQTDQDIIADNLFWTGPPGGNPADINSDGSVGVADLVICAYNLGLDIWTYFGIFRNVIETQTVIDLQNGTSTILTFIWNTTGVALGNYIISAYAWPVSGEKDTADNSHIYDNVEVVPPPITVFYRKSTSYPSVVVNRGYEKWEERMYVNVTLHNNGTEPIDCTVNVYYFNASVTVQIGAPQNIANLSPCNTTTLTFSWNLSGLPKCTTYTVKANVTGTGGYQDEFFNGQVYISIAGDASNDNYVSSADIIKIGDALFANPGDSNHSPYADVSGDGFIGAGDIIVIGDHLFESCST